jgi:PqqD family protein of HPr-rel-A system
MSTTNERLWRLPPNANFNWTQCGEEHIVFHPASGETHYLNDLSALTLRFLEDGPSTAAGLHQRISDFLDIDAEMALKQQIDALLVRFDQLGIVEQCKAETNSV